MRSFPTNLQLFVLAVTVSAMGTGYLQAAERPNIVWIMFDDGRADALGCYGRPWAKTPHLDAIAERGVRFATAVVQNPVCTPSRTCMKTGLYAHQTGVMAMGKPADTTPAYAAGIRTSACNLLTAWQRVSIQPLNIGKVHVFRRQWKQLGDFPAIVRNNGVPTPYGLQKIRNLGFAKVTTDRYQWMIGGVVDIDARDMRASRLGDRAVETIEELARAGDPFFLRVSFHAPHVACVIDEQHFIDPASIELPLPTEAELQSKSKFEREHIRAYAGATLTKQQIGLARGTYYGMVHLVDDQVGRIVQALQQHGLEDSTIIAVNSDQGFQLGEHGVWKKRDFYDTNVCIPMIFSYPQALPRGKVIDEPVESIDFLPTLMQLSDLPIPSDIQGRSLLPLIRGEVSSWNEAVFSEHDHSQDMYPMLRDGGGRRVMVRTKDWKLIFFMDERLADKDGTLYDLKHDPWETINLYHGREHQDVVRRLEKLAHDFGS